MAWNVLLIVAAVLMCVGLGIVATNAMLNRLQTILSTDTGSIAAATALKVHLASAAFTPSANLVIGSLTEATFTGYAPLNAGIGTAETFTDPTSAGNRIVQLLEPAGGWHWQTSGATGLPMTIYGYYVTDNAAATLWGAALFTTPVVLSNIGDAIDLPTVRFQMPLTALS